jgi:hypothetical protein
VLKQLVALQKTLPLILRHLVQPVQLPQQPLLVNGRQPVEGWIVAQHLFLFLHVHPTVLIEPVSQMPRRRRARISPRGIAAGISVPRPNLTRIGRTCVAARPIRRSLIAGPRRCIVGHRNSLSVALRPAQVLRRIAALALPPCGSRITRSGTSRLSGALAMRVPGGQRREPPGICTV